jgi:hypothetical protein
MRNLTLAVRDSTYLNARVWAAERDSTITSVVRYMLENLPSNNSADRAFPPPTLSSSNRRTRILRIKLPSN